MTAVPKPRTSETEYLALERASRERKCEWVNGEMYAMTGASYPHNVVTANLAAAVHARLRGKPCRVVSQDLRTRVDQSRLYTYPDVLIVCGSPQFIDGEHDTLTNPSAIFEVLSPSTESWDRGGKFRHYQRIESLAEYVLLSQTAPQVEVFRRGQGHWAYELIEGLDQVLRLGTGGVEIALADIYDGVDVNVDVEAAAMPAPPASS